MRLDVNDVKFFDDWRKYYDQLSDEEQLRLCNKLEEKYPEQKGFTRKNFDAFFKRLPDKEHVIYEAGGWKGELAEHCLKEYDRKIKHWTNIECSTNAVDKGLRHVKYNPITPASFRWFGLRYHGDVFISSHMIEHLSNDDALALLDFASNFPIIYLEAPISMNKNHWKGYKGTHILNFGWIVLQNYMEMKGYKTEMLDKHTTIFVSEDAGEF